MDDDDAKPLVKFIEEHRPELVRRMMRANSTPQQIAARDSEAAAVGAVYMNRVLDAVVRWISEYRVNEEGVLVAIDFVAAGTEITPEQAIERVDRSMSAIAQYAREQFGPGALADSATRRLQAMGAVARMVVASEVLKRMKQKKAE